MQSVHTTLQAESTILINTCIDLVSPIMLLQYNLAVLTISDRQDIQKWIVDKIHGW